LFFSDYLKVVLYTFTNISTIENKLIHNLTNTFFNEILFNYSQTLILNIVYEYRTRASTLTDSPDTTTQDVLQESRQLVNLKTISNIMSNTQNDEHSDDGSITFNVPKKGFLIFFQMS